MPSMSPDSDACDGPVHGGDARADVAARGCEPILDGAVGRAGAQPIRVRLAYRPPIALAVLLDFLEGRAVAGVECYDGTTYRRTLRLARGDGVVGLASDPDGDAVVATFALEDRRDLPAAIARCRHLLNLEADPAAVDGLLGEDALLGPLVARTPGIRVPGAVDGFEIAMRAVVGQQVSVAGARTVVGELVRVAGEPLRRPAPPLTHTFPSAQAIARAARENPAAFAMPASRRRALAALADAVATGELTIDPVADPQELQADLRRLPGIGPWTAAYVSMRAAGDPDAFPSGDLGVMRAMAALGETADARNVLRLAERWRPWRAYAVAHLWRFEAAELARPPAAERDPSRPWTRRGRPTGGPG